MTTAIEYPDMELIEQLAMEGAQSALDAHLYFVPAEMVWSYMSDNGELFDGVEIFDGVMPEQFGPSYREACRRIVEADRARPGHVRCSDCLFDKWDTMELATEFGVENPTCCTKY